VSPQLLKVATPASAVTALLAQARTPRPRARYESPKVTTAELETTLPPTSSIWTTGDVLRVSPSTPPPGGVDKTS